MIRNLHKHNRIFATGLSLLLTIAMIFAIPASAAEAYEVPFSQTWSGGGNDTVTYRMTPQGDSSNCSYYFEEGGETGTLSGNATGHIVYSWTTPGVYVYDLEVTNTDRSNYSYDRTVYRIRVYARNTDPFVTVQDLSKAGDADEGKVNDIVYRHSYSAPSDSGDGGTTDGGGGGDSGGGNDTPSTPTNPTTPRTPTDPTNNIDESGSTSSSDTGNVGLDGVIQDIIQSITEWGNTGNNNTNVDSDYAGGGTNHSNSYTGDDSNMILYGSISILAIITLIVWFIKRKHA